MTELQGWFLVGALAAKVLLEWHVHLYRKSLTERQCTEREGAQDEDDWWKQS